MIKIQQRLANLVNKFINFFLKKSEDEEDRWINPFDLRMVEKQLPVPQLTIWVKLDW